jgi:hypothetical protein
MEWTRITPHIHSAVEALETEIPKLRRGSREHAKAQLAWHRLMDAHSLLSTGDLSVADFQWAIEETDKIVASGERVPGPHRDPGEV